MSTVDLGTVKSELLVTENYSPVITNITRGIERMLTTQTKAGSKIQQEGERLKATYNKVAASLDPVISRSQKYDKTVDVLTKSLKSGLISQEEFNRKVAQAGEKYGESQRAMRLLQTEADKLGREYQQLVERLDPVVRKTSQYDDSVDVLNRSLKASIITQDTYNKRISQLGKNLDDSVTRLNRLGSKFTEVGSSLTQLALPIAAIGGYAVKASIDFESSFAGVRKTVDATEAEFRQISESIRDLASGPNAIPIDVNQLNAIAESAGQLGIAKDYIVDFTTVVANLGETTNLSFEEAATELAQFQNIFGEAGKDVDRLASTVVALGNAGASTEKQIVDMGLRIAGAGKQIGLTQGEVLGIASALSSVGIEAEAGGSAISQLMIDMRLAVAKGGDELHNFNEIAKSALPTGKDFAQVFKEDAAGGVQAFFQGLINIQRGGGDVLKVLDDMGIKGIRLRDATLRMAGAENLLHDSLQTQKKAWQDNTALTDEANKRYGTSASQLKVLWGRVKDLAIEFGDKLVPVLKPVISLIEIGLKPIGYMVDLFGRLPKPVQLVAVAIGGLTLGIGPALFVTGQLIQMWATLNSIAPAVVASITSIRLAILGLVGVIAAVGLALDALLTKYKETLDAAIQFEVKSANLEGRALKFAQAVKGGSTVTETQYSQANKDLIELRNNLKLAEQEVAKQKKLTVDPLTGAIDNTQLNNAQRNLNSVRSAYNNLSKAIGQARIEEEKAVKTGNTVKVNIKGIGDEAGKAASKLEDLAQKVRDVIATTLAERINAESALKTRKLGIEALELERNIQAALAKIKEAGTAATSSQRLEILQNVIATKQAERALADYIKVEEQRIENSRKLWEAGGYSVYLQLLEKEKQLRQDARDLTLEMMTLEERRSAELTHILSLLQQGLISQETFNRYNRSIAEPNFGRSPAQQENFEFVTDIIQSFRSIGSIASEEMARIERAFAGYEDNADMMILKEKALADVRAYLLDQHLSQWGGFFQTLGGLLGGVFQKISQAISNIQQAVQAGNQLGGILQSYGGAGSWAGALGGVFGVAQVFYEVYKFVDDLIEKKKLKKWSTLTTFSITDGESSSPNYFDQAGQQVSNDLRNMIQEIIDSIGAVVNDLPEIAIRARKDGKQFSAYVAGTLVGVFADAESAVRAAVQQALSSATFDYISQEFQTALQQSINGTFEDLQRNIQVASQTRALRIGDAGASYLSQIDAYRALMQAQRQLGLSIEDTIAAINRETQSRIANALGVNTSVSDSIRDLRSLSAGIQEASGGMRAAIQQQIDAIQDQIAQLESGRAASAGGPSGGMVDGGSEGPGLGAPGLIGTDFTKEMEDRWSQAISNLRRQMDDYIDQLDRIPQALSDQQMSMGIFQALYTYLEGSRKYAAEAHKYALLRVDMEFALIKLEIERAGKWEEFAAMFNDAYAAARAAAGREGQGGGRGGGRSGNRQQVRDFISDREYQLSTSVMSDHQRQVADITRQYQEMIAQSGKDVKLRAEVIALRDRELEQLNRQNNINITQQFRDFVGISNNFEKIRETAKGLVDSINSSTMGDPRKARMIARIMEDVDRQIAKLSMETARGLFGEMIGDLERYGASEGMLMEARKQMAILEHTLKMIHYQQEIDILRTSGNIGEDVIRNLESGLAFLRTIDPTKFVTTTTTNTQPLTPTGQTLVDAINQRRIDEANQFAEALKRAREGLDKYKSDGLDPLTRELNSIFADFREYKRYLGESPEVIQLFNQAVQRAIDDFLQPVREARRNLFYSQQSSVDVMGKWTGIQLEAEQIKARFRSGDLKAVEGIESFTDQFIDLASQVVPIGSDIFTDIQRQWDRFLAEIETDTPGYVDSGTPPMNINGMDGLTAIGEAQVDRLDALYKATEKVADGVGLLYDRLDTGLLMVH